MQINQIQGLIAFLQRIKMNGNEVPTYLTCVNTWANTLQAGGQNVGATPPDITRQTLQFLNRTEVGSNEATTFMEIVQALKTLLEPPAVPAPGAKPELLEEKPEKKKKVARKKKAAKK